MKLCSIEYCENELCVYSNNKFCLLDTVVINELGYCDSFILIPIPEKVVNKYKHKARLCLSKRRKSKE